ncbi:glycerate kinase [Heyndrickxia sporothermodurans]|uniref:Glycerate kinase n=1 Tax=Heyndrickxia sporothermodurans TaxID=46224 RepID=A0AB37HCE0_9BACI|nr:glycerate kinase [Heyndrickxia sporothermodurans]MBL5768289.1 glycerate kinase [Heyndrickxia sporothermodurans]MBL5771927.1 glycerate kinase [Heyndrickxia sporothermodurans]MBL5775533.1 glycerate kinase [Heyndrickxia sporothermodurans]MBL5779036.1 glycerate kinase [Heyndrickxia sporothermodurans]MBL5782608.1 glycerate kinase [Heyndrickxia sporothermodurans]
MKIVIVPDSFKESLTALEAANAIEEGFSAVIPDAEYIKLPMADGGEGTVQSLVDATNGKIIEKVVTGPLGLPVQGFFGLLGNGKTAVIEMSAASGIHHVPLDKRNPLLTTTYGTGELIVEALNFGAKEIIMGLGGSATNDGGAGMAQALGAKLLNNQKEQISFGGAALSDLKTIDISQVDSRLSNVQFIVACDVDNPLTGENGASAIFGPQKGATQEMVNRLDKSLLHFANIIKKELHKNVDRVPGAGAAGGMGAGMLAFFNAELKRGIDIVTQTLKLETHLEGADLVITGEGKIDGQTIFGKTPIGVAKLAKKKDIPVIGVAGYIEDKNRRVREEGIDALFSIVPGATLLEDAMTNAYQYLKDCSENIARVIDMFKR